ncbi:ABC transporter permease [Methylophaga pinxianii]|uniref:ABC transporter permease n=1 Tax=Methylophaga pinxianii TaxID=2881052 RepID=UPI001CF36ABB|nr:ABC transporter permease [Methylophaga pinxianii]MCB2428444.1 ABC transporter permease [Methylophaga pinxianii]UPH45379.1 ABC transporter permease [Methylophaga pinxianii]
MNNYNSSSFPTSCLEEALEWARTASQKGNLDKAVTRWEVLLKAFPNHPPVLFGAIALYLQRDDIENANRLYQRANEQFPDHQNILFHGAQIAQKLGDISRAEALLETARQNFPDKIETWLQSTNFALTQNLYEQAELYNQQARSLFADHPQPHKQYAEIAMQRSDWQTALIRWESFRKQFPERPAGYLLAAEAAEKAGDKKLARKLKLAREYGEDILAEAEPADDPSFYKRRHRHATFSGLTELIWTKAVFNLRSETQRNYLSYLWWIIEPLLHMVVYFLVFGFLLQRGGEGFITFLLTGLIPYMWFNKAMSSSNNSIIAGQGLMLQVAIPSIVFPLVTLLQATIKQIPVYAVLLGFVWLQGHVPNFHWWALVPIIAVQLLLTVTFGTLLAALVPFVRDVSYLVPTGLTFLMFLSGVFYSYESIPPAWQDVFLMNPLAFLLKCYREVLIDGVWPDFHMLGIWTIIASTGLVISMLAYKKLRYVFPRVVLA